MVTENQSWAEVIQQALLVIPKQELAELMGVCSRSVERYAAGLNHPHPALQKVLRPQIADLVTRSMT
jgi:hypothetical protein